MMKLMLLSAGIFLSLLSFGRAEVKPDSIVSDGMVLEQQTTVKLSGSADAGEKVTVTFRDQSATTVADGAGRWSVSLPSGKAGGPFPLTIAGTNSITLPGVYVGEVWLVSGQSNVEYALSRTVGGPEASAASANPLLHFFVVPHTMADTPQANLPGKWQVSSPDSTKNLSAVGYWFGSKLQKELGVPVGIIVSVWGGTTIEAWLSHEALTPYVATDTGADLDKLKASYEARLAKEAPLKAQYDQEVAAVKTAHSPVPRSPRFIGPLRGPSLLYNGMIAPLEGYTIKGLLWYQGEQNCPASSSVAAKAPYAKMLVDLIRLWRDKWGEGNFPFIIGQLAAWPKNKPVPAATPGDSAAAETTPAPAAEPTPPDPNAFSGIAVIREAQRQALREPNTALVVTIDLPTPNEGVHYLHKEPVGERVKLAALALAYGGKAEYSGPLYQGVQFQGGKAIVSFTHLGGGLVAKDGPLTGFTLAGADGKFFPATATINQDTVVVSSPDVPQPTVVRYGWADVPWPPINLRNKADLPASPFESDASPTAPPP